MSKLHWTIVFFVLAGAGGAAHSQVLYGSLTGNLTDPAGAAVPGARVEITNQGTNVKSEAMTDQRGVYLFTNLQPGLYKVTTTAPSFRTYSETGVSVQPNEIRRVDVQLQIAQTSESVEVTADAVTLQTDKPDIHSVLSSQEIEQLPYTGTQGKNFQSLLFLLPGAGIGSGSNEANSQAGNPQRAITFFFNGVSSQANGTRIDGTQIAYPWLPVNVAYVPPSEAIEQVNISTNAFDAEQGVAGGAAVNLTIKSGSNQLHGVLFERNTNNDLAAVNDFFSHPGRLARNIFNQFGFAVGGPIWIPKVVDGRNKLFFFVDWEATRRSQYAAAPNLTLPTPAMRGGDFSATPTTIYDPLTGNPDGTGRQQFPNNTIPPSRIAPQAVTMANLLPDLTRSNSFFQNYDAYGGTYFNLNKWDYKVNYDPTSKAQIWGRYSISPMDIYAPLDLGKAGGDAFNGGNAGHAGGRAQVVASGFTYAVSPSTVLDGNVGYTRQNIGANGDAQDGDFGLNVLHIPGTNGIGNNYLGIPAFQIVNPNLSTAINNLGNPGTGSPFQFRDNQYLYALNLGKVKGPHNLRFGFEYDHYGLNHFQPQGGTFQTARGSFRFDGTLTALNGGPAVNAGSPSNSWAQFLLGNPSEVGKATQFSNPNALRFSTWSLYARDSWQVTRKLTVDYGLRWEYYPIYSHDHYGAVRYDPVSHDILVGCMGGVPCDTGASASKKDFGPRAGLAYRLGEKTVVRTGYGISIDPDNMRNQRNQYPSSVLQDFPAPKAYQFVSYAGVANSDGATQVTLSDGIPAAVLPDISVGVIKPSPIASPQTYLPSIGTVTFPAYINRGYYQSWNVFVEHEFSQTLDAEVGYAGTHGVHIDQNVNINAAAPGTGTAGRQLYPYLTSDLNMVEPFGDMTYNGLQTRARKRFGSSFVQASYTFSKTIDNYNGDNDDGFLLFNYPLSYRLDKALAGIDRTHVFQLSYVWDLPFGKGHSLVNHGWASWIVGGWQLSGILSRFSGLPFSVGTTSNLNGPGNSNFANQISPDVAILGGHDQYHPYFNGNAFANPPNGVVGNTGRDILRGPGLFQMNQNISRNFVFRDGKITFQLRGEAYNLTNTPVFGNPGGSCCWSTSATTGAINYNGFGTISSTVSPYGPRYLSVGGYLRF